MHRGKTLKAEQRGSLASVLWCVVINTALPADTVLGTAPSVHFLLSTAENTPKAQSSTLSINLRGKPLK